MKFSLSPLKICPTPVAYDSVVHKASEEEEVCAICLDTIAADCESILSCNHVLHKECEVALRAQRAQPPRCPLCRHPLKHLKGPEYDITKFIQEQKEERMKERNRKPTWHEKWTGKLKVLPSRVELVVHFEPVTEEDYMLHLAQAIFALRRRGILVCDMMLTEDQLRKLHDYFDRDEMHFFGLDDVQFLYDQLENSNRE